MTGDLDVRGLFAGPVVVATFVLLVGPVVLLNYGYPTPLALPGYLILTIGSAIGNAIAPQYELWVYWIPFALAAYGIAVVVGAAIRGVRRAV
ncbi:hypothetical protein [Haloarchaeobius sp. TZWWS8]|uniref:hypothetical protein n=1 Tax=Haloarchaeobius sp. TZWWS8 TaxID=3446121 RepID=UPI003EC03FCA